MLFGLSSRLLVIWILTDVTMGGYRAKSDTFYFPDQTDYIRQSAICKDELILWPGTGRCYREGEQGPCNIGRILRFDGRFLKPYCSDT